MKVPVRRRGAPGPGLLASEPWMGPRRAPSAGVHSTNSPRVQLTLRSLNGLEVNAGTRGAEAPAASKKAAQKLTNFRAYLHKSSVAACFVDLLEMANDGIMTESGLYPSSHYRKSRNLRRGGFIPPRGSRSPQGASSGRNMLPVARKSEGSQISPPPKTSRRHRRRPSTAIETHTRSLAEVPDLPLTSRVPTRFAPPANCVRGGRGRTSRPGNGLGVEGGLAAGITALEIQRTHWAEDDGDWTQGAVHGADDANACPEINESRPETDVDGVLACKKTKASRWGTCEIPKTKAAWGEATKSLSTTVSNVALMKSALHKAKELPHESDGRMAKASRVRNKLIEGERRRAEEVLVKNDNRKRAALEAAALVASQRGLMEAVMIVVATKRIWTAFSKLSARYKDETYQTQAAQVIQRAYKAYSSRRVFKVLLSIRRLHMKLHIGICIRRKRLATTKIRWFLATGSGGAKARPRMVMRAFMYHVRRCQRAAKDWLACRAASIEAIGYLWERIEAETRRALGDELDRAKRVWMKRSLQTGQDSQMHGQWRELKAKTRSLLIRIDRLETQIENQQNRDKQQRVIATKANAKRRCAPGVDGAPRISTRLLQVDSADDLRNSTVPSSKRLAIIRSNLKTKFSLHLQGGRRVERTGNRIISEMDARMLIQGDLHATGGEGEGGSTLATKRSRALILTGDLGRPWQQIVEDTVMQDFRRTAFTRKDSMPYLQFSALLSVDMFAASGNVQGPSAAIISSAATSRSTNNISGRRGRGSGSSSSLSGSTSLSAAEAKRRARRQSRGSSDRLGSTASRPVLEPIL